MAKAEVTVPSTGRAMAAPTAEAVKQAYDSIIHGELPPEVGDPDVTARAILLQFAAANSFDDVFKPQKLPSWQSLAGKDVVICGFHLNPSTFEDGSAVYAIVELIADDSGEPKPFSCGGQNVMIQLVKAWEKGWFPFKGKLVAQTTRTGNTVLRIESNI